MNLGIVWLIWGIIALIGVPIVLWLLSSCYVIVRPTERAIVERLGKFHRVAKPGISFRIPVFDRVHFVNITEMMVDATPQTIITKDKLNAQVDAQIYFKVKPDDESIRNSQYNVYNYKVQIINLARTTLRNIIGTLSLTEANSDRNKINSDLMTTLKQETVNWGIEVVRAELKEIDPPPDVQDTMNQVVKAENQKTAALDFATATATKADGERQAAIKQAEGVARSKVLVAEAEATQIRTVAQAEADKITMIAKAEAERIERINTSADTFFKGNAKMFKQLEAMQASLQNNSKIILTKEGINPTLLIGNLMGEEKKDETHK